MSHIGDEKRFNSPPVSVVSLHLICFVCCIFVVVVCLFSKSLTTLKNFKIDKAKVCLCVCPSQAIVFHPDMTKMVNWALETIYLPTSATRRRPEILMSPPLSGISGRSV